ncbi:Hypothetical predicted protein [Octopus vulgaris]|uniref:ADP-ribosyl cyclase/cyclic ADP-ribose hydrolase n=1 Tax=Octopus vulgaris TaxID=6645 RepID=A0AA36BX89_OCTVU|nr:Hypothetical predicted protein [Octopus vulgaris]
MEVMLLTLTTILAVTSGLGINEANYKRLEPGYSYDYIETPLTQPQFPTVRSRLECAAIALNSQSEVFTYNSVSRVCKNYTPKDIITVVNKTNINEIAFYRLYALSMGLGSKVYESFLNEGIPSTWNVSECIGAVCPNLFRHPFLDLWDHLSIDEVKLVVYKNQTAVVNMVFDGRNTSIESWFSREKLKSSPWSDVFSASVNLFAMEGFHGRRRFYMSSLHNDCGGDSGWFMVVQSSYCPFEEILPAPVIFYSPENLQVIWNDNSETADSMAIFIRLNL